MHIKLKLLSIFIIIISVFCFLPTVYGAKVKFESNGGSKIEPQEVDENEQLIIPSVPTKNGYIFEAWCVDENLSEYFDFETEITNDTILYAKWIEKNPTVHSKKITWTNSSSWAIEELEKANALNVIPEIFNEQDLTQNITRKEFAHITVKLYEKISGKTVAAGPKDPFTDTDDPEVLKAYNLEITNGTSDTTFTPDALITREQMATMMTRALKAAGIETAIGGIGIKAKFNDNMEISNYAFQGVYFMAGNAIIKGIGNNTFNPKGNATIEQALIISERCAEIFAK